MSLCDKVCQRLALGCGFSLDNPHSSTNRTYRHNLTKNTFESGT